MERDPRSAQPSVAAPRRTQEQRRTETRSRLVEAAAALINERGQSGLTLAAVGARAGYSRGIASYHFGTQAGLIEALLTQVEVEFESGAQAIDHTGPPIAVLTETCRVFLTMLAERSDLHRAFLTLWAASVVTDNEHRSVMQRADRHIRKRIAAAVARGIGDGTILETIDPSSYAVVMLGQLRGIELQHLLSPDDVDLATTLPWLEGAVRRDLASPAGG